MQTKEIETSFGRVTVSPIPAFVQAQLYKISNYPTIPMEVVTGLGGTETLPVRPGTEEYERYIKAVEEADERRQLLTIAAAVGLGVRSWKIGNDPECDSVPDDWQPPPEYESITLSARLKPAPPITEAVLRRADFLLLTVITSPHDLNAVIQSAIGIVSDSDVQAAERLFRG